ncbi:MAG: DUF1345 domain-containing protein [Caulobacteraceae bacterium]|nr:DUF1345 domain-containing protein [Caulobacter sp.]
MRAKGLLRRRWRTFAAAAAGVVAGVVAGMVGLLPGAASLVGWDVAAALYLLLSAATLFSSAEHDVRHNARMEDENRAVIMSIVLACVAFSFGAIVVAQREAKQAHVHSMGGWLIFMSVLTIVLSWMMVQTMFTFHYAHHYFGDRDSDGQIDGGVQFQGDAPSTYFDFIYMAICVGCCFQVSDFALTNTSFRNLVTVHAVLSFAFNTLVLALGINIVGSLMGS